MTCYTALADALGALCEVRRALAAAPRVMHEHRPQDRGDHATGAVGDQVPHRVGQRRHRRRALRVHPEVVVLDELDDLPERAEPERDEQDRDAVEPRVQLLAPHVVRDVDREERSEADQQRVAEVQRLVEPADVGVEIEQLAERDVRGREPEQQDLDLDGPRERGAARGDGRRHGDRERDDTEDADRPVLADDVDDRRREQGHPQAPGRDELPAGHARMACERRATRLR